MNGSDSIFRPGTANGGGKRTPRISGQGTVPFQQNTRQLNVVLPATSSKIMPITISNSESGQLTNIKTAFQMFTATVSKFLSHNGATNTFRNSVSQQIIELEKLFAVFYQFAGKANTGMPALSPSRPTTPNATQNLKTSAIAFLKNWKTIVLTLVEIRKSGPQLIKQSIETHYNVVNQALESVMHNGSTRINIHDPSYRNCRSLQSQMTTLRDSSLEVLRQADHNMHLKKLSADIKAFSRLMNDAFSREFSQCGIAQNEIVRLRTRSYTACSDVIHSLRAAFLFQSDIKKVIKAIIHFQNSIRPFLEKYGLPTQYLIDLTEKEVEEEEEEEIQEFDDTLSLVELIKEGVKHFPSGEQYFSILEEKAKEIIDESENRINSIKQVEEELNREKMKTESIIESQFHMKNSFSNLRSCFIEVTRSLSGKDFDESDDEVLMETAINSLHKDCPECLKHAQNEKQMKQSLQNSENQIAQLQERIKELENRQKSMIEINRVVKPLQLITGAGTPEINEQISIIDKFMKNLTDITNLTEMKLIEERVRSMTNELDRIREENLKGIADAEKEEIKEILSQVVVGKNVFEQAHQAVKIILDTEQKLSGFEGNTLAEKAQSAIDEGKSQLDEYVKSFNTNYNKNQIVTLFTQLYEGIHQIVGADVQDFRLIETIVRLLDSKKEAYDNFTQKIITSLNDIVGPIVHQPSSREDLISLQLQKVVKLMKADTSKVTNLQTICSNVESELSKFLAIDPPAKKPITETIPYLLKNLQNVVPKEIVNIEAKLCKALNQESSSPESKHILVLIDQIEDIKQQIMVLAQNEKGNLPDLLRKATDPKKKKSHSSDLDLEDLFKSVFDLVPVTTRSDPATYIPEICAAFSSLHNSIIALKPFASIMNAIFTKYDGKLTSFVPGSQSYQFLKTQIYSLHTSLNAIAPSKINSLVFLVLSRFIALFSSFMSSLSSIQYDDKNDAMKKEFFRLQTEVEKLAPH